MFVETGWFFPELLGISCVEVAFAVHAAKIKQLNKASEMAINVFFHNMTSIVIITHTSRCGPFSRFIVVGAQFKG